MKNYIETFIVDSFTDEPFKGNPAGVCVVKEFPDEKMMLLIAQELGLSETAFIIPLAGSYSFAIRYFSPKMEIPLCGHATLAASKVLFSKNEAFNELNFFNIQNLKLAIKRRGEEIEMKFPIYPTEPSTVPAELLSALGLKGIVNSEMNKELEILLLEIEDCQILKKLEPNFGKLVNSIDSINGVLLTAKSDHPEYDFESRYFWPWSGTNEDPVTGGTHTFLGKYWADRLDKTKLNSFQCSQRGGFMELELLSESELSLKSKARIVLEGKIQV